MVGYKADRRNSHVYDELRDLKGGTERAIRQTWFRLGKDLKVEANTEILRRPKSGITYYHRDRAGRRRRHVASKPGETHANRTGKLRRSISWVVHGSESMEFGYGFSTTARNAMPPYAEYVEDGTPGGKMAARPSILNAIRTTERNTTDHFYREMARQFERSP
jgi:hypothetical protein